MPEANVHHELVKFIVICVADGLIGIVITLVRKNVRHSLAAIGLAVFTTILVIAGTSAEERQDGQIGVAIGMFLAAFFLSSYAGLLIGSGIRRLVRPTR